MKTWINHTYLNCQQSLLQCPKYNAYLSKRKCHKQQIASQDYIFPSNCPANMHSFPSLFWKKKCKERVLKLSWPRKCTIALTAKMMLINSLNTWQNKNKQKTEYDFPFNIISHCYMKNSFVLNHKLFGWLENSPLNLMVYQEVVLMLFSSLKKVIKYNISRGPSALIKVTLEWLQTI